VTSKIKSDNGIEEIFMSYELMNEKSICCPCKKGYITARFFSNDWNQFRSSISIECPTCEKLYKIQSRSVIHGDHCDEMLYIVSKDDSICSNGDLDDCKTFSELLSVQYPLELLVNIYNSLAPITNYKYICNYEAKKIAYECKRKTGTLKVSALKKHLQDAIQNYDSYETNWIKERERINEVISRSIPLRF
jgi:hypothetical protein